MFYLLNNIKPKMIAIIQSSGFALNWTDFQLRNYIFAKTVFYNKNLLPDYLINGGIGYPEMYNTPIWDEYDILIGLYKDNRAYSLWKFNPNKVNCNI